MAGVQEQGCGNGYTREGGHKSGLEDMLKGVFGGGERGNYMVCQRVSRTSASTHRTSL